MLRSQHEMIKERSVSLQCVRAVCVVPFPSLWGSVCSAANLPYEHHWRWWFPVQRWSGAWSGPPPGLGGFLETKTQFNKSTGKTLESVYVVDRLWIWIWVKSCSNNCVEDSPRQWKSSWPFLVVCWKTEMKRRCYRNCTPREPWQGYPEFVKKWEKGEKKNQISPVFMT